jgi:predicted acyltransferase
MKTDYKRLLAIDVLRGMAVAGMIFADHPGNWDKMYAPLQHSSWHGLTPVDLVFPFFMFIMGISMYISLQKYGFKYSHAAMWKIVKRCCIIFVIGLVLDWLAFSFSGKWHELASENLPFWSHLEQTTVWSLCHIRILGVLQRLALSYCFAAIFVLLLKHKHIPYLIGTLLVGYLLILIIGNGYEYSKTSILSIVDHAVLGVNHIWAYDNVMDPEGVLSTIPTIAHVLIGFCFGKWIMEIKDIREKLLRLFLAGTVLIFLGFFLDYGCPIIKKIWSPTFVLVTCGLGASLLALLIWTIDVKGYKNWCRFFEVFGVNALAMFVIAAFDWILLDNIRFMYKGEVISLPKYVYGELLQPLLGDYLGSLAYTVLFISLVWVIGYVLYRKKIYIRI